MKPSAFEYYAPGTLEEALALLDEHGEDAKLLAGGQSLVPLMNLRMAAPEVLIDLNRVEGLASIREESGALVLGAMTRYVEVEESLVVAEHLPMLARATAEVGYTAIRSRGTVGGSLAHADPVGEWPCLARALDAELVAAGPHGQRTIAAADFFGGIFTTTLAVDEVLVEVRFPLRPLPRVWAFDEFAPQAGDYAIVAVAVELGLHDGTVSDAHIAFTNLADRPVRSAGVERTLVGRTVADFPGEDVSAAVSVALGQELGRTEALADRIELAGVVARRAVASAFEDAQGGTR